VVNPEAGQAVVQCGGEPAARAAPVVALVAHRQARFRGQHDVAAATGDGLADQLLGLAAAVHVGSIDEVDPALEGGVDEGGGLVLGGAPDLAEVHRAEHERADLHTGAAQGTVLHDRFPPLWVRGACHSWRWLRPSRAAILSKRNNAPSLYGALLHLSSGIVGGGVVIDNDGRAGNAAPRKRADARRNEQALLDAAAALFVASGVEVPVRDIAARAGVGMGTIYRHFPTRADLIIAVYRHQVEACAEAGPALLASSPTPHAALAHWIDLFVDFLVTKHGLAAALRSDDTGFAALHAYFLDRLVPVCAQLLDAAVAVGEIRPGLDALTLMYGVGNLCIGADNDPRYDARLLVGLLIAGLRRP